MQMKSRWKVGYGFDKKNTGTVNGNRVETLLD